MNAKQKAIQHLRVEKEYIVLHQFQNDEINSYETSFHSSIQVEEAIDIALEEQLVYLFDNGYIDLTEYERLKNE